MKTWYSCKVKHAVNTEDGLMKQITDNYLVDAVSYTDAEKRIYEISEQDMHGEFSVTNISKTNISEIIPSDVDDKWFKCKVTYVTIDGDTEKEAKINTYYLVASDNLKSAYEAVEESLNSMLVPFEIPSITLTNFIEVLPYLSEEERPIPSNLKPIENNFENDEDIDVVSDFEEEEEPKVEIIEEVTEIELDTEED